MPCPAVELEVLGSQIFANAWNGLVDFDSFTKVLNRPGGFRDPGEPEEYCRGFQVFDKDLTGFIGVGQLRYSMSTAAASLAGLIC